MSSSSALSVAEYFKSKTLPHSVPPLIDAADTPATSSSVATEKDEASSPIAIAMPFGVRSLAKALASEMPREADGVGDSSSKTPNELQLYYQVSSMVSYFIEVTENMFYEVFADNKSNLESLKALEIHDDEELDFTQVELLKKQMCQELTGILWKRIMISDKEQLDESKRRLVNGHLRELIQTQVPLPLLVTLQYSYVDISDFLDAIDFFDEANLLDFAAHDDDDDDDDDDDAEAEGEFDGMPHDGAHLMSADLTTAQHRLD